MKNWPQTDLIAVGAAANPDRTILFENSARTNWWVVEGVLVR